MSFDWSDRKVQRAFVYGCFESKQLVETAVELIKKHATVDTLTVHAWNQEFRATEHISESRGRPVDQKVPEQGTQIVNSGSSIPNSDFLADREIKREIEVDSETGQPELKRSRRGVTTDMGNSSTLTQEIREEVNNPEKITAVPNTTKAMNLIPPSSVKVELYEDCDISELEIWLSADSVSIAKQLTDNSCIPSQEFPYKTEDPTQYSFIHRAISEVNRIFNTSNLKLNKLKIDCDDLLVDVTEEKKRTFYEGIHNMMAQLSKKLHLSCLDIDVESPEELIGFLKTIDPKSLTELSISNRRESFDMSQVVLLEHWPNLEYFFSGDGVNIPISKLAHMSSVFGFFADSTTIELKQYFSNLTETPLFSHSFRMDHPRMEPADFSETLEKHKLCDFSNGKVQQCYLLNDGSVISVLSTGRRLYVRKEADSRRRYAGRCCC